MRPKTLIINSKDILFLFQGLKAEDDVTAVGMPASIRQIEERYKYGGERTVTPPVPEQSKVGLYNMKTPSPPKLIGTYAFLQNFESSSKPAVPSVIDVPRKPPTVTFPKTPSPPKLIGTYSYLQNTDNIPKHAAPSIEDTSRKPPVLTFPKTPPTPKLLGTYSFMQNRENVPPK